MVETPLRPRVVKCDLPSRLDCTQKHLCLRHTATSRSEQAYLSFWRVLAEDRSHCSYFLLNHDMGEEA